MAWLILVVSGLFEAVWAVALSRSDGFTRPGPALVFAAGLVVSMAGLAYALRSIPVGTGYAVWVAVGAGGAALYGMVVLGEPATAARIACLLMVLAGVMGLKWLA